LAKASGMTVIGFVKSESFNVYCGEERVLEE
jgi:formate dehydrogenase assembly factor FdhD